MNEMFKNKLSYAFSILSAEMRKNFENLDDSIKNELCEIRLRVNRPLTISLTGRKMFVTSEACLSKSENKSLFVSAADVDEAFNRLCNFSVYSFQKQLAEGYITIKGGHRVGICGTAVYENGRIATIKDITSLNIRIAREIKYCAEKIYENPENYEKGVLIAGPPGCGKTTVLRDFARAVSLKNKNVTIVDERGEISGSFGGTIYNDVGLCDVLNSYEKSDGIMRAVRCLNPNVIVCDEIGTQKDCEAITEAISTGASIAATFHADSAEGILNSKRGQSLIASGAFGTVVMLKNSLYPSELEGIYEVVFDTPPELRLR